AADRDAPHLDRIPLHELPDLAEPSLEHDLFAAERRAFQPQRTEARQCGPPQNDHADDHFTATLHATSSASSGRPSMKARTTGSSTAWISAGVPTNRTFPW